MYIWWQVMRAHFPESVNQLKYRAPWLLIWSQWMFIESRMSFLLCSGFFVCVVGSGLPGSQINQVSWFHSTRYSQLLMNHVFLCLQGYIYIYIYIYIFVWYVISFFPFVFIHVRHAMTHIIKPYSHCCYYTKYCHLMFDKLRLN